MVPGKRGCWPKSKRPAGPRPVMQQPAAGRVTAERHVGAFRRGVGRGSVGAAESLSQADCGEHPMVFYPGRVLLGAAADVEQLTRVPILAKPELVFESWIRRSSCGPPNARATADMFGPGSSSDGSPVRASPGKHTP